jgi:hypothetical protein
MYMYVYEHIPTAYFLNLSENIRVFVYLPSLSLLDKGLVNMFPRKNKQVTTEEMLDTRVCCSVCPPSVVM